MDEFYLMEKSAYGKHYFLHDTMIYGYDNKEFMTIGYNKGLFIKGAIPFSISDKLIIPQKFLII